mmetsp:Transcript_10680/g.17444  ORF Transcript_10680/g.17444 Transcript_10680/m.17444 type:complete len:144 (+) Transcript_10680:121-552(+)|eukprot:CAMPEP_0203779748 /NCGR_PEP_ID=MMETSP0099_2-20121227/8907_1 /ASSEMBLY_ACC=CAM_ASM_000209 /TAXON_ID=96639 /ORGANISM=" , Strain NY0313808BC1" /LENGTH=143 /DNA_ID=CAMNT_0050679767 /DNA_START=1 /DNA_END=432 /DNA_ORIENTATION=+
MPALRHLILALLVVVISLAHDTNSHDTDVNFGDLNEDIPDWYDGFEDIDREFIKKHYRQGKAKRNRKRNRAKGSELSVEMLIGVFGALWLIAYACASIVAVPVALILLVFGVVYKILDGLWWVICLAIGRKDTGRVSESKKQN